MTQPFADALSWVPKSRALAASLTRANDLARARGHQEVRLEHLLLALIEDPDAAAVLLACTIDLLKLNTALGQHLDRFPAGEQMMPVAHPGLVRILEYAVAAARQSRRGEVNGAIVLAAIVGEGSSEAAEILKAHGLTFQETVRALQRSYGNRAPASPPAAVTPAHANAELRPGIVAAAQPTGAQPAPSGAVPPRSFTPNTPANDPLAAARRRVEEKRANRPEAAASDASAAAAEPPPPEPLHAPAATQPPLPASDPVPAPVAQTLPTDRSPALAGWRATDPPAADDANFPPPLPARAAPPMPTTPPPPSLATNPSQPEPEPPAGTWTPAPNMAPPNPPGPARMPPPMPPLAEPPAMSLTPQTVDPYGRHQPPSPPASAPPWTGVNKAHARRPQPEPQPPRQPAPTPDPSARQPIMPPASNLIVSFDTARLVDSFPRRMRTNKAKLLEVRLPRTMVLASGFGAAAASATNLPPEMPRALTMRLKCRSAALTIETAAPETQFFDPRAPARNDDAVRWRWTVTPKHRGQANVVLSCSMRTLSPDGMMLETAFPDQSVRIDVRADVRRFAMRLLGWLIAAAVGGGIALAIGALPALGTALQWTIDKV